MKLKLLADENVHAVVIARLRGKGYEVEAISETAPGLPDHAILARDDIGELALITYDRDFGDLIFNRQHPAPAILIYSRLGRAEGAWGSPPRFHAAAITGIARGIKR